MPDPSVEYIDTLDYKSLETKLKNLHSVSDELGAKVIASRRLRYVELDIEGERSAGRLQPDEIYVPQHIIDTNIRREQSSYVQYVTQSPRAVIVCDPDTPSEDTSILERDLSTKLRYDGWQLPMFADIDGMQQDGYGIMEVVYDESQPGHCAHEFVQFGDFAYVADTRNIQEAELIQRSYYFSKTKLKALAEDPKYKFSAEQVKKIIEAAPVQGTTDAAIDSKDKSLYKVDKVMFRVRGIVHVAWACQLRCDNWVRDPVPLFIGRRKKEEGMAAMLKSVVTGIPSTVEEYETEYPYILFPYLISENDTISQLKGRVYLDQDCQEAASSLMSSFCTGHRRAAGLYFSNDSDDPNQDLVLQKNVYFKQGTLINKKIKQFQVTAPDAGVVQAIQAIVGANQNETSQVNFAAMNRVDSRKTATEVTAATQTAQALSTVQVVLFSNALRQVYTLMYSIIRSRVLAGLITVTPAVRPFYDKLYYLKPAGDVDVIERQQLITTMAQAWPIMSQTAAAPLFLMDLISRTFPEQAAKYNMVIQQALQQQQQQAEQQKQQMMQQAGNGIVTLSRHPEFFSDAGKLHALPVVQEAARSIEQMTNNSAQ